MSKIYEADTTDLFELIDVEDEEVVQLRKEVAVRDDLIADLRHEVVTLESWLDDCSQLSGDHALRMASINTLRLDYRHTRLNR